MEGVIFIRGNQITEKEEQILNNFKEKKSISANTRAVQAIIVEYDIFEKENIRIKEKNLQLNEKNKELEEQLKEYKEFFSSFKKFLKLQNHE